MSSVDPNFVKKIVHEVKLRGVFDEFRKSSIADVDTKPAYQNLRLRVENEVKKFLSEQTWTPESNKNQLRERLRRHITEAGFLDVGVERIVDQVVNPKVGSVFQPKIEEIAYECLGLAPPNVKHDEPIPTTYLPTLPPLNGGKSLKIETSNLLPTDLEQVSPDSDSNPLKFDVNDEVMDMDIEKIDDDDSSPPFELLEKCETPKIDNNNEIKKLSGDISCQNENNASFENQPIPVSLPKTIENDNLAIDIETQISSISLNKAEVQLDKEADTPTLIDNSQDSQLSQVSSDSHISNNSNDLSENIIDKTQSLDKTGVNIISEEAQMPKFNENSSETNCARVTESEFHFDIKKDEIKFEGTGRKVDTISPDNIENFKFQTKEKSENQENLCNNISENGKKTEIVNSMGAFPFASQKIEVPSLGSMQESSLETSLYDTNSGQLYIEEKSKSNQTLSIETERKAITTSISTPTPTPATTPIPTPTPTPTPTPVIDDDNVSLLPSSPAQPKGDKPEKSSHSSSSSRHRKHASKHHLKDSDRHRSDERYRSKHSSSKSKHSFSSSSKHKSSRSDKSHKSKKSDHHSRSRGQLASSTSRSSSRSEEPLKDEKFNSSNKKKSPTSKEHSSSSRNKKSHPKSREVIIDDHNESKGKLRKWRKSTDSNDDDKYSTGGGQKKLPSSSSAEQSNSVSSSTKSKSKNLITSNATGSSRTLKNELSTEEKDNNVSPTQQQKHRHKVVILNDILENPTTNFIEFESSSNPVQVITSTEKFKNYDTDIDDVPELHFLEEDASIGLRLEVLSNVLADIRTVIHIVNSNIKKPCETNNLNEPEVNEDKIIEPIKQAKRVRCKSDKSTNCAKKFKYANACDDSAENNNNNKSSPTPSDASCNSKENEIFEKNTENFKKSAATLDVRINSVSKLSQQRYLSEDLYKPRPILSQRSKRRGVDSII